MESKEGKLGGAGVTLAQSWPPVGRPGLAVDSEQILASCIRLICPNSQRFIKHYLILTIAQCSQDCQVIYEKVQITEHPHIDSESHET